MTLTRSQKERRKLYRTCTSKEFAGETKREAKAQAKKFLKDRGSPLYPYQCQYCGKWHLTKWSKDRWKGAQIKGTENLCFNASSE